MNTDSENYTAAIGRLHTMAREAGLAFRRYNIYYVYIFKFNI